MKYGMRNVYTLNVKNHKSFAGVKHSSTRTVTRITTSRHIPKAANDNRQPTKQPPCAAAMAA
ncbi:hypothetical protein GCM10011332_29500 [Terasakiella brassicae]|uniref:Uncharacterized protein n=2 Tax=Terasakiella brassicae TaxID=1634917 RepID=A0A917C5U8_9PROT|nr:hypothetical protein GCM10011332_29500 [Terasakiella brassicae]